jgi:hypothetical protein
MALSNYDGYIAALNQNAAYDFEMNAVAPAAAGRFHIVSALFTPAPTIPTTSVSLDKTSGYAINQYAPNTSTGRMSILGAQISVSATPPGGYVAMIVDILNMSGGMSGIVTGTQTTNIPTASLTRYTDGEGVHAAIIVHATVGTTSTTVTATYTNQSAVGSRVTSSVQIGGAAFREAGTLFRLPLQAGDTGIRSVESINIVGTTGTAGNIGIVLYKPLALVFMNDLETNQTTECVSTGRMVGQFNETLNNACLSVFGMNSSGVSNASMNGCVFLAEV